MAELEKESPSSVSHDALMSGSGTSEVNKASFSHNIITEECELDKNNTLPSTNVSNNFKSNNGVSIHDMHDANGHSDQLPIKDDDDHDDIFSQNIELVEMRENKKNEQLMSQNQSEQHSSNSASSNGELDVTHEVSAEAGKQDEVVSSDSKTNHKKKRGVRFPDDTSITCCCDPPDPWKNAPIWTTDELITAYKKSCELNGVKPVVKILQQLHGISTPGKRKESFVLKGEKLDQKQVECIEEIFRRVQFTLIDLEATHLDDECAVALFDMIEHYESACQLNISFNRNISARGWQACSRLVRRTPTLNFLDIRNCDLTERTIPIFGRALKMGCHLTVLHMEGMSLTTRPLIILVAALKMNDTLQELFLAENKLVPSDGVQLGNLLRYNYRLNLLDLRNNNLQDVGISHLCDGLVEQKSGHGLRTLVLWNNQISYQAMHALGRAIAASASLETLNIGHNGITNEGIHQVKDGLLKTMSLLRLGLQGTRISDEGAVALAEYIADSTMLLRIDLRDNDIKTGGLMALSHAMRVNNSVTRIDLDKETKKESGMKDYADVQIRLLRDILTFQERNVQLVMEREEAERARLEKLAIDAEAAREKERVEKESGGKSPLETVVSNTESFTIIEPDSDEVSQEVHRSSDEGRTEEVTLSSVQNELENSASPSKTFSVEEEVVPAHQRPSVLFARMGLQPQESLDSPRTPSSDSSQVFQSTEKPPTRPTLPLCSPEQNSLSPSHAPPAEMLLSPQYYPKQLARKIFSVSRVSEESGSPLPTDGFCEYDPLNVSLVSLVPVTDPSQNPSDPTDLSLATPSMSTEPTSSVAISPTSLFQDLADETVKHIVSTEDSDQIVSSSGNGCVSSAAESQGSQSVTSASGLNPSDNCDKDMESDSSQTSQDVVSDSVEEAVVLGNTKNDESSEAVGVHAGHSSNEKFVVGGGEEDTLCASSNIPGSSGPSTLEAKSSHASECVKEICYKSGDDNFSDSHPDDEIKLSDEKNVDVVNVADTNNELNSSQDNSILSGGSNSSAQQNSSFEEAAIASNRLEEPDSSSTVVDQSTPPFPHVDDVLTTNSHNDVLDLDKKTRNLCLGKEVGQEGVEVEDVELSLEEEPWTALGEEESSASIAAASSQASAEEKQPDFFTTLSMNGLTQELASALTSLDGSVPDCEDTSEEQS